VEYAIDFAHPRIGIQKMTLELTPESFGEVDKARTFGFLREVEALYARGLALGGSLDNSVVLDESGVLNPDGLRYPDEFVRHKILDFIGDMAMLELPLQGRFTVACSGHALNNQFLRLLNENRAIYLEEVTLDEAGQTQKPESRPLRSKNQAAPAPLPARA
jgi:UDP-3-O-[3-hydroxymyristoyl] N-acetylglucosamine deacetylase